MEFPKLKFPKFKSLKKIHPVIKILLIILAIGSIVAGIILDTIIASAYREDISMLAEPLSRPLVILDKDGEVVSELSSDNFTPVPFSEIPDILVSAIVAVEDKRFYDHSGVDIIGISRSFFRNFKSGSIVGGGSTITQQLVKNLFLTPERTYTRKINEAIIAIRIEREYEKDKILELYLNQIYFGEGKWGVQDAAMVYFGKNVQDINLPEAALLAALPKAPTHYSPFQNLEKAKERRDLVLNILFEQEIISKDELEGALNEEIILSNEEMNSLSIGQ